MVDTCVSRVPIFSGLSPAEQQQVAALARPVRLHAGELAYSAHDEAARLIVVHTGRLRILRVSPDGYKQLVRVLGPGDFTGETAVFTGAPPSDFAAAVEDCQLCVFRHHDLTALVRQHPETGLRMLAIVSERLAATEHRLNALTSKDVESRLAHYLLALPATAGVGGTTVTLPMPKKDVASIIDTTPESLSRAFRTLADQRLIAMGTGRSVTITRAEHLRRLADGE